MEGLRAPARRVGGVVSGYRRARPRRLPAAPPREADLQSFVRAVCRRLGLLHYHTHRSERAEPGFPDSVIVGPSGVLFRELKSDTGRPTADQQDWLRRLREAGADADLWRPEDQCSGRIVTELQHLARRRPATSPDLREELAVELYLLDNSETPAAAGRWDLLLAAADREPWHRRADAVTGLFAAALPRSSEQIAVWLHAHHLTAPSPQQVFASLADDLTSPRSADP